MTDSAFTDPEMRDWLRWQADNGTGFLRALAAAAQMADCRMYAVLRPALLLIRALHSEDHRQPDRDEGVVTRLSEMRGRTIVAKIPALDENNMVLVKLHEVECCGVWVESQAFTDRIMHTLSMTASNTTLLLFIPFQGIDFILASLDLMSLSETSYGIRS